MKVFEVIIKNETAATCIQRFSVVSFKMDKSGWNQSRKKNENKNNGKRTENQSYHKDHNQILIKRKNGKHSINIICMTVLYLNS